MSISININHPQYAFPNVPARFTLEIANTGGSSVEITGINVIDKNSVFTISSFSPVLPIKQQIWTGGTPTTSSVPAWGTANQSNITYYVGNVSGSNYDTFTTSGSYGGKNTNSKYAVSSSVIIPAGATGVYVGELVSGIIQDLTEIDYIKGRLQAQVMQSGSVVPQLQDASSDTFLIPVDIVGVSCELIDNPALIYKTQFARPPQYLNFDGIVQTTLRLSNGINWVVPPANDFLNNYTSSDPARISVIQTGQFRSTTPSTTLTNSVGSIFGGQNTQLSASTGFGAGAVNFTFPNQFSPQPEYATISNEIAAGLTGSVQIGLAEFRILGGFIQPSQVSIQSGSIVDLDAYVVIDAAPNNPFKADANTTGEPTWSSSNSTFVPVGISGSITGAVDTQAQVVVKALIGGIELPLYSTITLNKIS